MLEMNTQFKTVIAMAIVLAISSPLANSLAKTQSGAAEPALESAVAVAARFSQALARGTVRPLPGCWRQMRSYSRAGAERRALNTSRVTWERTSISEDR